MKKTLFGTLLSAAFAYSAYSQTTVVTNVVYVTNTVAVAPQPTVYPGQPQPQTVVIQQPAPTVVYQSAPQVIYQPAPVIVSSPMVMYTPYYCYPRPVVGIGIGFHFGGGYHHYHR